MFAHRNCNKKSSAHCRGQEIPVVPPQFTAYTRPHGIQTDPQAVSGSPVFPYCNIQGSHSERYSTSRSPLPRSNRQLSWRIHRYVLHLSVDICKIFYYRYCMKSTKKQFSCIKKHCIPECFPSDNFLFKKHHGHVIDDFF